VDFLNKVGPVHTRAGDEEVLHELAERREGPLLVYPVSFVSEHQETLYELDILYGDQARAAGLDYRRLPTPGCRADFIECLRRVTLEALVTEPLRGAALSAEPPPQAGTGGRDPRSPGPGPRPGSSVATGPGKERMDRIHADVIVVGGGISGLACAFRLARAGRDVRVMEREALPGGCIRTLRAEGFLFDLGPNTLAYAEGDVSRLCEEAGVASRLRDPGARAALRFVLEAGRGPNGSGGGLTPVPSSPGGFFTTPPCRCAGRPAPCGSPSYRPGRPGRKTGRNPSPPSCGAALEASSSIGS
jgi:hypothetical protein